MKDCLCGDKAEIDFTGCIDYKGHSYQSCIITCKSCFRSVSIEFDADKEDGNKIQTLSEETWDKINNRDAIHI